MGEILSAEEVRSERYRYPDSTTEDGAKVSDVLATHRWPTNAHLIADCARLGYLDGRVLDATYGPHGGFWKVWTPAVLVTNDLYAPADTAADFRALPFRDQSFDAVVFDPPYKLSGTPSLGQFDTRYGIDRVLTLAEKIALILDGAAECWRVARRYLLVKCQDQVVCGRVRWQTDEITERLAGLGARKADRFDFVYTPRKQRSQVHARRNTSQLLVFARAGRSAPKEG